MGEMMKDELSSAISSKLFVVRQKILSTGDMVCLRFINRAAQACASPSSSSSYYAVVECKEYLWEQLHSYHWKDVPEAYRDAFGYITLMYISLTQAGNVLAWGESGSADDASEEDRDIWRMADIGLLLGADLCR